MLFWDTSEVENVVQDHDTNIKSDILLSDDFLKKQLQEKCLKSFGHEVKISRLPWDVGTFFDLDENSWY